MHTNSESSQNTLRWKCALRELDRYSTSTLLQAEATGPSPPPPLGGGLNLGNAGLDGAAAEEEEEDAAEADEDGGEAGAAAEPAAALSPKMLES
jgi:hypothetical protein